MVSEETGILSAGCWVRRQEEKPAAVGDGLVALNVELSRDAIRRDAMRNLTGLQELGHIFS
jgi:hypothetical protein